VLKDVLMSRLPFGACTVNKLIFQLLAFLGAEWCFNEPSAIWCMHGYLYRHQVSCPL